MPSLGNPRYKAVVKTASGQEYDLYKSEFESKVILFGKLYCEFRKRNFFDRKWF